MFSIQNIIIVVTILLAGLVAGLFYAYSCSVNPGLGRLPDTAYLRAMQSINRAILNPVFFLSFMGTLVILPLSTFLAFRQAELKSFYCLLAACLIYTAGVFGVTMFGNVPLNEALDRVDLSTATPTEAARQRLMFEIKWNRLNTVRTIASIISFLLVIAGGMFRAAR